MITYAWLLFLFPLLGAVVNLVLGRRLGRGVGWVATVAVALAFAVAAALLLTMLGRPPEERQVQQTLWSWITVGNFQVEFAMLIDPLSITMALVVTGVSAVIHLYSVSYMAHDERMVRYFVYLNFFVLMMLILVMANNFLMMYVGWEGVGLASYLLIGFWFAKPSAADAGNKAFLVNRIGDVGLALAIMLIWTTLGTVNFLQVDAQAAGLQTVATTVGLLLLLAATGKSAQLPLFVWLPDAMEGPTPVSALIHAATMVTAGVYMIARNSAIFALTPSAMAWVAWIGAATAFMAATIAVTQNDLKRMLAYSTISQLGFMFMGVGVGAYAAAIFHLVAHAFFKALLFLSAGSVMHALDGELDMRKMGGLRAKLPSTHWTYVIGAAALAGVPLMSGFFSKDLILFFDFRSSIWLYLVGATTAAITAFYAFRSVFLTFWGQPRDRKLFEKAHESPRLVTVPLWILAFLSLFGGLLNLPVVGTLEHFLEPVFTGAAHADQTTLLLELSLATIMGIIALIVIYVAYHIYIKQPQLATRTAERFPWLYTFLINKWYIDDAYMRFIIGPLKQVAGALAGFDKQWIDGAVNGIADGLGWLGRQTRSLQSGLVSTYALAVVIGVVAVMGYLALR